MAEEKNLENRLKKWLELMGIYPLGCSIQKMTVPPRGYYEKRWGGGKFTKAGLPDMHICVKGKSIEVELKATNGKPSDLQLHNLKQINESGGCGLLIYPQDFEKLKRVIQEELKYDN